MKKGEICYIEFPSSDGREQARVRPAVGLADIGDILIVLPLTSSLEALRFPYTIGISPSRQNGLKVDSVALLFQIRAIDRKRFKNKIGIIEKVTLDKIDQLLRTLLQL